MLAGEYERLSPSEIISPNISPISPSHLAKVLVGEYERLSPSDVSPEAAGLLSQRI